MLVRDTVWRGRGAMHISVWSWATTADDVEASLDVIIRVASSVPATAKAQCSVQNSQSTRGL